jgi:hypothetical protein
MTLEELASGEDHTDAIMYSSWRSTQLMGEGGADADKIIGT